MTEAPWKNLATSAVKITALTFAYFAESKAFDFVSERGKA